MLLLLSIVSLQLKYKPRRKKVPIICITDSVSAPTTLVSSQVHDHGGVVVELLLKVPVELLGEVGLELGGAVLQSGW